AFPSGYTSDPSHPGDSCGPETVHRKPLPVVEGISTAFGVDHPRQAEMDHDHGKRGFQSPERIRATDSSVARIRSPRLQRTQTVENALHEFLRTFVVEDEPRTPDLHRTHLRQVV